MSGYYSQLKWRKRNQCLDKSIPLHIYHWLFDPGSLTAKIKESCQGEFRVQLLSQKRMSPTPDEIRVLGLRYRSHAIIREVILFCEEKPWIYARSVIPVTTLKGPLRRLAYLGNKPLGELLFADRSIFRGDVEASVMSPDHDNYRWTGVQTRHVIFGRRSVFYQRRKKLLVSEFFLPSINL